MNKKSKSSIAAIVFTILAVSLVIYQIQLHYGINIFNKKEEVVSYDEEKKETNSDSTSHSEITLSKMDEDYLKQLGLYEKIKNSLNFPDKEDIHFKMINSADNFKTAKGEFIEEDPSLNDYEKVTFAVDTEHKTSLSISSEVNEKPVTSINRGNKHESFNDNDKIYREYETKANLEKPTLVRPIKLFLNPDLARNDLGYLGINNRIISSYETYFYLFVYQDWNYVESTFLGRDAYKIDGTIDPALSQSNQGKFSLFLDKETGIILQFISFDENGGIRYKLECTKLEINAPIDESIYTKDPSGYTKKIVK